MACVLAVMMSWSSYGRQTYRESKQRKMSPTSSSEESRARSLIWTCVESQIDGMRRTQEVKLPRLSQGRNGMPAERMSRDDVGVVESGR